MRLSLIVLVQFLIGRKAAIQGIAHNPKALPVGFIFCISAALARHYDGKYLVREPWFILAPAGASILTSSILFGAMCVVVAIKARRFLPGLGSAYFSFLGLYWMTAPLAWLYGIPYERFLNDVNAARANVWTLELVSLWRVLLMSRVFSVLLPCSFMSAFSKLGTFALGLVYAALFYARLPLIDWMGGVRVPPSVQPVASAYLFIMFFGFFAVIIGGLIVLSSLFIERPDWTLEGFRQDRSGTVGLELPVLALGVILVFAAALPVTQREQQLRYAVEAEYKSGNIDQALSTLTAHKRTEFPPQWTPPPWPEYEDGARDPKLIQIVEALQNRQEVPKWLISAYREKAALYLTNNKAISGPARVELEAFSGEPTAIESRTARTIPDQPDKQGEPGKTSLRIEFANHHHSFVALETTLGPGECSSNRILYSQRLNSDAGLVFEVVVTDNDKLCYRITNEGKDDWGEWHEIKHGKGSQREVHRITLP